jgi:patatin-like phospholipase/acyl hydrolase
MSLHKGLAQGRWFKLSLIEQLANVGMDVERSIRWKQKNNIEQSNQAFERALDLISLSILDPKNRKRLKELTRTREMLIDYFVYDNEYASTDQLWHNYFYPFNYAVALQKGR